MEKPDPPPLTIRDMPSEKALKARLKRWLKYAVDSSTRAEVARHTGVSAAHIGNIYNHEHKGVGVHVMVRMHIGLDLTLRELVHEEPPRDDKHAHEPSQTIGGRARKRA